MRLADVSSDMASEPVRWPLAASSSRGGQPSRSRRSSSRLDDLERLLHAFGRGARVDREVAGVVERGAVRIDGVREAALLADLLEQPGRHAAAERVIHHGERVTIGIERRHRRAGRARRAPARSGG